MHMIWWIRGWRKMLNVEIRRKKDKSLVGTFSCKELPERRLERMALLAEKVGKFPELAGVLAEIRKMGYELYEWTSARAVFGRDTTLRYISAKLRFLRKHGSPLDIACFRLLMSAMHLGRAAVGIVRPGKARRDVRFSRSYCSEVLKELRDVSSRSG